MEIRIKKTALENNISEKTFDLTISNVKFLPNVINMIDINLNFMKIQRLI